MSVLMFKCNQVLMQFYRYILATLLGISVVFVAIEYCTLFHWFNFLQRNSNFLEKQDRLYGTLVKTLQLKGHNNVIILYNNTAVSEANRNKYTDVEK